jgi:hypothetical protein
VKRQRSWAMADAALVLSLGETARLVRCSCSMPV